MSVIEMDNQKAFRLQMTKIGENIGITIPNELISRLKIQPGDQFDLIENDQGEMILKRVSASDNVRSEVLDALADVLDEYDDVLRTLKDK